MTLNYIWVGFFIVAFLVAIFKTLTGNPEIFSLIVNSRNANAFTGRVRLHGIEHDINQL